MLCRVGIYLIVGVVDEWCWPFPFVVWIVNHWRCPFTTTDSLTLWIGCVAQERSQNTTQLIPVAMSAKCRLTVEQRKLIIQIEECNSQTSGASHSPSSSSSQSSGLMLSGSGTKAGSSSSQPSGFYQWHWWQSCGICGINLWHRGYPGHPGYKQTIPLFYQPHNQHNTKIPTTWITNLSTTLIYQPCYWPHTEQQVHYSRTSLFWTTVG